MKKQKLSKWEDKDMTKEIMNRCEIYKDFDLKTKQMYDDAWTAIKVDSE